MQSLEANIKLSEPPHELLPGEDTGTLIVAMLKNLSASQEQGIEKLSLQYDQGFSQLNVQLREWMDHQERMLRIPFPSNHPSFVEHPSTDHRKASLTSVNSLFAYSSADRGHLNRPTLASDDVQGEEFVVRSATTMSAPTKSEEVATKMSSVKGKKTNIRSTCITSMEEFNHRDLGQRKKLTRKMTMAAGNRRAEVRKLIESSTFENATGAVLVSNSFFIGIQVQLMYSQADPLGMRIVDYLFTFLFLVELGLRMFAYGCYKFFLGKDKIWNCFDTFIVGSATLDTAISAVFSSGTSPLSNLSVLRILRIVRILRIFRIIRVMVFFKDLRVLIASVVSTLKTAFWSFVLLMGANYLFGITIAQMTADYLSETPPTIARDGTECASLKDSEQEDLLRYFGSLPRSILSLFMSISNGISWQDCLWPLFQVGPLPSIAFLVYIIFSYFCVLNVIIGIFCQNAVEAFEQDRDRVIECQLNDKHRYIDTLVGLFEEWDKKGSGVVTLEEFKRHLQDENMVALLAGLNMEIRDAVSVFEMTDVQGTGALDLDDFVTGCITLRGTAKAVHQEKSYAQLKLLSHRMSAIEDMLQETLSLGLSPVRLPAAWSQKEAFQNAEAKKPDVLPAKNAANDLHPFSPEHFATPGPPEGVLQELHDVKDPNL